jgi:DNA-binding LacI/PurR family transcriptional regulator
MACAQTASSIHSRQSQPLSIASLSFDSKELGARACKNLLRQIEGEETENRTLLPYEVVLKESTQ